MFRGSTFKEQKKVDDFMLTYKANPFPSPPASADFIENPAKFIIGRENELRQIRSAIAESLKFPEPKLMLLQGKQGIGKSTIISSIPRYLEEHKLEDKVLIVYFNTSNDPKDFKFLNFYKQAIAVLDQTNFLEKLVFSTLRKILILGESAGGKLQADLAKLPLTQEYLQQIKSDPSVLKTLLFDKIPVLQPDIKNYIRKNYRILRPYLKIDNFDLLFTLIDCFLGEETFAATKALNGSGEYRGFQIDTDNLALNAFNDIKKLTRWTHGEATFLIIFDHLERGLSDPGKVYHALFSLLLGLRQQPYTCILVSGTLDAFRGLYGVLEEDMKQQLDNWFSFYETLRPLSINSVINIAKRHLNHYWNHSNFQPPHQFSLYPFGEESVSYLYDSTNEDIRKTLIELHKKVESFKANQKVVPVITFFDAFSNLRQAKNLLLGSREVNVLAEKLLDPHIQDKTRSTTAEMAIYELLQIVHKSNIDITEIKHEPPIGRRNLKPDIYIELFGGLTLQKTKKVAIEVKIYRKTAEVKEKEVKKTHSLVTDGDVDYVQWVTTAPLSSAKHDLPTKYKSYIGRTAPLSKEEMAYLALAIYFKDIFSRKPDGQEANLLLNQIGIQLDNLITTFRAEETISPEPLKEEPIRVEKPVAVKAQTRGVEVKKITTRVVPKPLAPPKIEKPSIVKNAEKLNKEISQFITERSASGGKYVQKTTVIKQIERKMKIKISSENDEEQMDAIITEIAKKKGLRVTPTRVYFS